MAYRTPCTVICIKVRLLPALALASLVWTSASAETMYVTDQLRLRLHAEPRDGTATVANLTSGDAVEVLERGTFFLLVRTAEGQEGWAKTAFLVNEKPARLRVSELESALGAARAELQPVTAERDELLISSQNDAQRMALAEATAKELEQEVATLTGQYQSLLSETGADTVRLNWYWTVVALLSGLAAGGLVGFWLFDLHSRKRHGGYRVY